MSASGDFIAATIITRNSLEIRGFLEPWPFFAVGKSTEGGKRAGLTKPARLEYVCVLRHLAAKHGDPLSSRRENMKRNSLMAWTLGTALCGCLLGVASTQAADARPARAAFENGALWPDNNGVHINAHGGGILFRDGVYYWYGEHKIAGKAGNLAQVGVHVYSSRDLYHWRDDGIALRVSDDPASDIVKGCVLERPKVIFNAKTGKFVMWFHLELKGQGYKAARSGVAVADAATGPFTFLRSFRPDNSMARDQTLFVDDDGKAYHLYASEDNKTLHIGRLSDDYLSPSGKFIRVFEGRFMEAPAICKRDGKYYFIGSGCTGWAPNAARSAVAPSIWGPWKELGNPCRGVNPQNRLGPEKTYGGQSTCILPVQGNPGAFIAMFDIWRPDDAIDGRYVWLPMRFEGEGFSVTWTDAWDLSAFDKR